MNVLFFRNTHDANGVYREPESADQKLVWESVWNSPLHCGGFVGQMLDSTNGLTFDQLVAEIRKYEEQFDGPYDAAPVTLDDIIISLGELLRADLVRAEIRA